MRWRSSQAHDEGARARFAGVISFVVTLVLITILLLAKSAQASPAVPVGAASPLGVPSGTPIAALTPEEEEELEEEPGEGEGEEAEAEEEEEEEEEALASAWPPAECVLRSARSTVVVQEPRSRLLLRLAYTAFEPSSATIEYRFRGRRGSLRLGPEHRHLSERGVLRATEALSGPELAKVRAAGAFTVRVRVPGAPRYCARFSSRQLSKRRVGASSVTWLQTGAASGS